jgi:hypothetical protein
MPASAALPPYELEPVGLNDAHVNVGFAANISLRRATAVGRGPVLADLIASPRSGL